MISATRTFLLSRRSLRYAILLAAFAALFTLCTWGVSQWFWMMGDQERDWEIALHGFGSLPLVGPPTHVGGYTIGPAFYWIMWGVRVVLGPWFDNLPHGGGIGQAALLTAADVLLCAAVWHRTRSAGLAFAALTLTATSAFDPSFAALVWNPVMGSTLSRCAMALVLFGWSDMSASRLFATAAIAWSAVHAYTGAIYVTVGVFAAFCITPLQQRDWQKLVRVVATASAAVILLQVPLATYRLAYRPQAGSMSAVVDSVSRILTGDAKPELAKSARGLVEAVAYTQARPWQVPYVGLILLACAAGALYRYRRDPVLLSVTVLPLALTVAGYALFLADLDSYYYLSLMPSAVLLVLLAIDGLVPARARQAAGIAMLLASLAMVPGRVQLARSMNRMHEVRTNGESVAYAGHARAATGGRRGGVSPAAHRRPGVPVWHSRRTHRSHGPVDWRDAGRRHGQLPPAIVQGKAAGVADALPLRFRMRHLGDNAPEEPLERLLLPSAQRSIVRQVDHPRLRQRRLHWCLPVTNQVGRPEMTRPPRNRAVQEHFAIGRRHRRREGVEFLRPVRILGRAAHRDVHVLDSQFLCERGFVEAHARHLLRHSQVHESGHASGSEIAERLFRGLAADEHVVAHAHEFGLEHLRRIKVHRVRHGAGPVLADHTLGAGGKGDRDGQCSCREDTKQGRTGHRVLSGKSQGQYPTDTSFRIADNQGVLLRARQLLHGVFTRQRLPHGPEGFLVHQPHRTPACRVLRASTAVVCLLARNRVSRVAGVQRVVRATNNVDEVHAPASHPAAGVI